LTIFNRFERKNRFADHNAERQQNATDATEFPFRFGILGAKTISIGLPKQGLQ
jgi:hypothetical protein